jgi:hypothetical protein
VSRTLRSNADARPIEALVGFRAHTR